MIGSNSSDLPPHIRKEKTDPAVLPPFHIQEMSSLITQEQLDGTNYIEWSLNAQNKIKGRKRWGCICGTKVAPIDKKSEEYETWEDENCHVKSSLGFLTP